MKSYDCRKNDAPLYLTSNALIKYNILLIEDNPGDARLIQEYLQDPAIQQQGDWALNITGNIAEARQFLANNKVEIILLDLSLPDSTGLDTLNVIWAMDPKIPIVILTGVNDENLALAAMGQGAQDYLAKNELTAPLLARTIRYSIERKHVEEQLRFLATHDTLTELPNRSLFYDRLRHATLRSLRRKKGSTIKLGIAIMVLDIDKFKSINDTYGHTVGDEVLRETAHRLSSCIRNSDTVARMGGDEFTIILEGVQDTEDCEKVAQKILDAVRIPLHINGEEIHSTVSIGISMYPADSQDIETLIKQADIAMYDSKQRGSGYRFYSETT